MVRQLTYATYTLTSNTSLRYSSRALEISPVPHTHLRSSIFFFHRNSPLLRSYPFHSVERAYSFLSKFDTICLEKIWRYFSKEFKEIYGWREPFHFNLLPHRGGIDWECDQCRAMGWFSGVDWMTIRGGVLVHSFHQGPIPYGM
jgi:hypothetical protein